MGAGKIVKITADLWHWCGPAKTPAAPECFFVHTTGGTTGEAVLRRWKVSLFGKNFTNDYYKYEAVPAKEIADFQRTFAIPEVCTGNIFNCDSAHAQGKLSAKNLRFVKQGLPNLMPKPQPAFRVSEAFLASKGAAACL